MPKKKDEPASKEDFEGIELILEKLQEDLKEIEDQEGIADFKTTVTDLQARIKNIDMLKPAEQQKLMQDFMLFFIQLQEIMGDDEEYDDEDLDEEEFDEDDEEFDEDDEDFDDDEEFDEDDEELDEDEDDELEDDDFEEEDEDEDEGKKKNNIKRVK